MLVKFRYKTKQTAPLKSYYICKKKHLRIITSKPQTPLSDCIFKENKILKISYFVNYKYALLLLESPLEGKMW